MLQTIRAAIYASSAPALEELARALEQVPDVNLVQPCSTWDELRPGLAAHSVDLVLVNLDPVPEEALQMVQQILRLVPDMAIIGVSVSRDPTTIISAMRSGCGQFVCAPIEVPDLEAALNRIRTTRAGTATDSRRICVIGASGGVGATTLACNLAFELADVTDRPSALVDLNVEYGDIAAAYDVKPKYSLADICRAGAEVDRSVLETALCPLPCGVAILGRPENVADAHNVTPEGVSQTLGVLGTMFAYVIVDLPRSFNFLSTVALSSTHTILIVTQLSVPSIRNAARIVDTLMQMGAEEKKIEFVINRWKAEHDRIAPEDVERQFGRPVFALIPNDYRRVSSALDFGHPMRANSPSSPARLAIREMAKSIAAQNKPELPGKPKAGLFKKLWAKKAPA